mgnify:CR=1 FL=1
MKIYNFYEGELHVLEVTETKNRFTAKYRYPAFGYGLYFDKNRFSTSERETIDTAIERRIDKRTKIKKEIEKIDHDLNILHRLLLKEL